MFTSSGELSVYRELLMSYCDGEGRHSSGLVPVQGDILFHTGMMMEKIRYIYRAKKAQCHDVNKVAADDSLDTLHCFES